MNRLVLWSTITAITSTSCLQAQPFVNDTQSTGLIHQHQIDDDSNEATQIAAGGTVEDVDQDGDLDVYLIGGRGEYNRLFENQGDGTYEVINSGAATTIFDVLGSGPIFLDVNGDQRLDLLTLSVNRWEQMPGSDPDILENRPRVMMRAANGSYTETPGASGFTEGMPSFGAAAGDLDRDGDLDLFMTHWVSDDDGFQYFWENDGNGSFSDVTNAYLGSQVNTLDRFSFTPNITDINGDGWPDVLLASDFGVSQIFISDGVNNNQLTFTATTPSVLTDENGMGASVGDYDNDGDMDWFITSIWDPNGISEGNWGITGNRLYRNDGNGNFEDVTDAAGVRQGYWGWGSCFADFNNDGHLDIYHENGFSIDIASEFHNDPARLFMSNGDGTFTESAIASGLDFDGQGRGVSCFDHDLDGDLDILVMPNDDAVRLYRNDLANGHHYLSVFLHDTGSNPFAVGARIAITTASGQQIREVTAGSNFVSNNPMAQHFGLGSISSLTSMTVTWPDGSEQLFQNISETDRQISVSRHCHTTRLTVMDFTPLAGQQATLNLHTAEANGTPLTGVTVNLSIAEGPNAGINENAVTDVNGVATFNLTRTEPGLDRLSYTFDADSNQQTCQALINWLAETDVFADGFE